MKERLFSVVITGKLLPHASAITARPALKAAFPNLPDPRIELMLAGNRIRTLKSVPSSKATSAAQTFRAAGLEAEIVPDEYDAATLEFVNGEKLHSDFSAPASQSSKNNSTRKANYFVRHFTGQLPLWMSFWINGICVSMIVSLLGVYLQHDAALWEAPPKQLFFLVAAWVAATMAISSWQLAGIWNSATKLAPSASKRSIPAQVVRGLVVVNSIFVVIGILAGEGSLMKLYQKAFTPQSYDECVQSSFARWEGEAHEMLIKAECLAAFPPRFDWDSFTRAHNIATGKNAATWSTVRNSDIYKNASPEDRLAIREDYWSFVLKPQVRSDFLTVAHKAFMSYLPDDGN